jgi:putative transposase
MNRRGPFRCFRTSPEVIRRALRLDVRLAAVAARRRGPALSGAARRATRRCAPGGDGSARCSRPGIRTRRVGGLRASRGRRHLGEGVARIDGVQHDLRRAPDHEGEGLEASVTKRRDRAAALKLPRKLGKRPGRAGEIVTDKLRPYGAALREVGAAELRPTERWLNSRAETSRQPLRRRERAGEAARPPHALLADVRCRALLRPQAPRRRQEPDRPHDLHEGPHRRSRRGAAARRRPSARESPSRDKDGCG